MVDTGPLLETLCAYQDVMRGLVALLVVMTVLLAFSLPFLEPGTGPYAIAVVDIGLLVAAFVLVGGTSVVCARREP